MRMVLFLKPVLVPAALAWSGRLSVVYDAPQQNPHQHKGYFRHQTHKFSIFSRRASRSLISPTRLSSILAKSAASLIADRP